MASPLMQAVVAATLAAVHHLQSRAARTWVVAIACAITPDLDALGYWLGVPYESFWGHRRCQRADKCLWVWIQPAGGDIVVIETSTDSN